MPTRDEIVKNLHQWFLRGVFATTATDKINEMYGYAAVQVRSAQNWFKKFRKGRRNFEQKKIMRRRKRVNYAALRKRIKRNPMATTKELAENLCSHMTVWSYLKKTGKMEEAARNTP